MEEKEVKIVYPMRGPGELGVWKWKTPRESCVSHREINTEGKGETKATPISCMNQWKEQKSEGTLRKVAVKGTKSPFWRRELVYVSCVRAWSPGLGNEEGVETHNALNVNSSSWFSRGEALSWGPGLLPVFERLTEVLCRCSTVNVLMTMTAS